MSLEKWILVIAAVLAVGTGVFFFQHSPQDTTIVEDYVQEMNDETIIKDLIITVDEGVTEKEVISAVKQEYPSFEIVAISKNEDKYLVRIKKVGDGK